MTTKIENTNLFNMLAVTFHASNKDLKRIVVTMDRGKQIADSADQYIVEPKGVTIDP